MILKYREMKEIQSKPILAIISFITLLSLISFKSLSFDFQIEDFFPKHDKDVEFYYNFQDKFNARIDENALIIALQNNSGIFNKLFLKKIDSLTSLLNNLPDILKVYSISNTSNIYYVGENLIIEPLIHFNTPDKYIEDSIRLFNAPEYRNLFIGKNGPVIAISVFINDYLSKAKQIELVARLDSLVARFNFDEAHSACKLKVEAAYTQEIKKNLFKFLFLSILLVCITLYLIYKSAIDTIIPLGIISISVVWMLGIISLSKHPIGILSSLLPPLIATISLSNIIYLSTKYRELILTGLSKSEATNQTFRQIGLAAILSSSTSALGFYTLSLSPINPVGSFGQFAAIGICISCILTITILYLFFQSSFQNNSNSIINTSRFWHRILDKTFTNLLKFRITVITTHLIALTTAIYFMSKVEVNGSLIGEIPKHHPILADKDFMEREFGGMRSFEMVLDAVDPQKSFDHIETLTNVQEIEKFLKDSCNLEFILSPIPMYKAANKAFSGGSSQNYILPSKQDQLAIYKEKINQTQYGEDLMRYLSADGNTLRISGKMPDINLKDFKAVEKKIENYFSANHLNSKIKYTLTGSSQILDKIPEYLVKNILPGLVIALILLSCISLFLFRNWKIIPIVTFTNILPLAFVAGIMGMFGIFLKTDTAIIFSVSFGMSVDNAINYINRYRTEVKKNQSIEDGLRAAFLQIAKPMAINTFVLVIGFMSLMFSDFGSIFYIGLLITLVLIFGLICNLSLLPVLVSLLIKEKGKY